MVTSAPGRSKADERKRWEETSKAAGRQEKSKVSWWSTERGVLARKPCGAGAPPSTGPGGAPKDTSRHQKKHMQSC